MEESPIPKFLSDSLNKESISLSDLSKKDVLDEVRKRVNENLKENGYRREIDYFLKKKCYMKSLYENMCLLALDPLEKVRNELLKIVSMHYLITFVIANTSSEPVEIHRLRIETYPLPEYVYVQPKKLNMKKDLFNGLCNDVKNIQLPPKSKMKLFFFYTSPTVTVDSAKTFLFIKPSEGNSDQKCIKKKFEGVFKVEETDFPELYKIKSQRALNLVEIIFLVLFITLLALAMIRFILFIASVLGPSFLSSEDNKTTSSKSKS
jgi:hypothetical protein